MTEFVNHIKTIFNNKVDIIQKRPGIMQLYLPIFHEDGDMVDIYLEQKKDKYYLCDYGKTLQRLSYEFDVDSTPVREATLDRLIAENGLSESEGNICMETRFETALSDILHVTHAYSKISSMRYFKKETMDSLFIEMLDDYIFAELLPFKPQKNIHPIPNKPEFQVDYTFTPNGHDVYLMAIKNQSQAKLAVINYQQFKLNQIPFRGWIIYESFDFINKNDLKRLTDSSDKQFSSFDNFKESIKYYLEKERA